MIEGKPVKKEFILNSTKFLFSNLILNFFTIIQSLVVANLLGPTLFGLKNAIQIVSDYGGYTHLGSLTNFTKKRQIYEFSDLEKRDYFTNITFTFLFLISLLSIIGGIIAFFVLSYSISTRLSVLIIGFLIPVYLYYSFFSIILQSKSDFKTISKSNILQGVVVFLLVILFVYLHGVQGFFLGTLLGLIIVLFYQFLFVKIYLKLIFDFKAFALLIRDGFGFLLLSMIYFIIFSINRVFIVFGFGKLELGYYAIALFFGGIIYSFINTVLTPFVPKIYQNLTKLDFLNKLIIKPTKIIYLLSYYIIFSIIFLLPFVIFIIPKYGSSLEYVNVLIFSVLFFPTLIMYYYIGINKEFFLIKLSAIFIFILVLLNWLILTFNLEAIFITYATLFSIFSYGLAANYFGYKEILGSGRFAFKEILSYLWPLGYALIGFGILWVLAHFWLYSIFNYYVVKVIQAVLFTIWYFPILWKIEKEHRIWGLVWSYLKGKVKKAPISPSTNL